MSSRHTFGVLVILTLLASAGCGRKQYTVVVAPKQAIEAYRSIQVSPVVMAITADSLAQSDLIEIRGSIIDAISEEDRIQTVAPDAGAQVGWLTVDCTVTKFDKGSRGARWLLGRFGGGAVLGLRCDFRDLASESVVGSADFEEKVTGGWFGGGADAIGMGKRVAKDVADYLRRGGR